MEENVEFQSARVTNKGFLLLALIESELVSGEIDDEFWNKFNKAWEMYETFINENETMKSKEIKIVG